MKLTGIEYFKRAQQRSRKGDDGGALADINLAIKADPELVIAYFARGEIRRVQGDPKTAIEDFTVAISLQPGFTLAYIGRGNARRNLGDVDGSLVDFNRAIELEPNNPAGYVGRGLSRSKDAATSRIEDFDRAIRVDPTYAEAYFCRGLVRMGSRAACADFTKTIKLNPDHGMAHLYRGDFYSARGYTDKAIADYTQAIELGVAVSAHVYAKRAVELLKQEDVGGAISDCNKAIADEPSLAPAYLVRGTAHFALGKRAAAIADLEHAIRLDPAIKTAGQVLDAVRTTRRTTKVATKRQKPTKKGNDHE